jgi:hypothetical protein
MPFPRRTALLALLAVLGSAPAGAQDVYTSRADFLTAFAGQTATNSLDGFDVSGGGLNPVAGIAFGAVSGTLSTPASPLSELNFSNFDPGNAWIVADGGTSQLLLSRLVTGFGASFFDLGTTGDVVFRLFDTALVGAGPVAELSLSAIPGFDAVSGNGFLGFGSATAFDLVEIEAVAGEFYELDDPVIGGISAIPEPATVALVAGGLVALAGRLRRRQGWRVG